MHREDEGAGRVEVPGVVESHDSIWVDTFARWLSKLSIQPAWWTGIQIHCVSWAR